LFHRLKLGIEVVVTPAKAGVQPLGSRQLDSGVRRNDGVGVINRYR
jgi:hypothetical protein